MLPANMKHGLCVYTNAALIETVSAFSKYSFALCFFFPIVSSVSLLWVPVEFPFKVVFSSPTFSSRTSTACFTRRIKSERVCPLVFGLTFILCMCNVLLFLILYSLGLRCILPQTNSRSSGTKLICALASIFKVISTSVQPASVNRNYVEYTFTTAYA